MVLSLLYFDIIFCYVIFSSTWQEIEGDNSIREAMNGMLLYSVKIFICMTVNIQKATKFKDLSQCIIQKFSETTEMNMCMCVRDGTCTSGVIYWWTDGHHDEEIMHST